MKSLKHKAGILMPISALVSEYGIGSLGNEAYKFVDFLVSCKQTYWQILPLGPTSYGDSPYQATSIYAGNPYFVDVEILKEEGLLKEEELLQAKHQTARVDYGWLFFNRYQTLRKAFSRFKEDEEYHRFIEENNWVVSYGLFMALKVKNNYVSWNNWEDDEKDYEKAIENIQKYDDVKFWLFVQYEFFKQWKNLKKYANEKGVYIIGDMPIYVAYDSVEVWQDKKNFLLDENYNPTLVAGCPPDDFSSEGQLWGNPIYDYEHMKQNNFAWWIDRFKHNLSIYDILRVDHFRGFASYYVIDYGASSAINGHWEKGYGYDIFRIMKEKLPNAHIIAEDLGLITSDVVELIDYCGFPRMKVLQFAFYEENSMYLPKMYQDDNCIVYTGTHDSDCSKSWVKNLQKEHLERFRKEVKRKGNESPVTSLIRLALNSVANYAIIPIQDYLELTNKEGRMNFPSTSQNNWCWKLSEEQLTEKLCERIKKLTNECNR